MTMLAAYGLDNYDDITEFTTLEGPWTSFWESVGPGTLPTTDGRFGGGYLRMNKVITVDFRGVRYSLSTTQPKTLFLGVSILSETNASGTGDIIKFKDGSSEHVRLRRNPSAGNVIEILILGAVQGVTFPMSEELWHRLEMKVIVDNAVGEVTINLDGNQVFTSTGIDTQVGSNEYTDTVDLQCGGSNSSTMRYDDITFNDDQGSFNNDFLGDIRIETLRPSGAGFVTDFTPLSGTNWESVDEGPGPDDDTSYVESSTGTEQDLYTTTDLTGAILNIKATLIRTTARKDDAGSRTIELLTRTGGSTDVGATQTLLTDYSNFQEIHEVDPDTGIAWIEAGVNAAEIGMENN